MMKGFTSCWIMQPPRDALLRFRDEISGKEWTGRAGDLHLFFDIAYLWWKWTGIERMAREI